MTAPSSPTASTPKPLKIKTIRIHDFRAFGGPEPYEFELGGKNLLVYGENGSGKSSIFHALDEIFSVQFPSPNDYRARFEELRNKFSGIATGTGFVEVEFDDGLAPARWNDAAHPVDVNPAGDVRVVNGAYRKAILDYRSLLDTNYRHADGAVNLFDVCVRVLLRDYPVVHDGIEQPLFELWKQMEGFARKARTRFRPHLRETEISSLNAIAASFNQGLRDALQALLPRIDPLLAELGWDDLRIVSLTLSGVTYDNARLKTGNEFAGCEIAVGLTFRGLPVPTPQFFLNEARLSALALAIYFAGRELCAPTLQPDTPRIMVLDDVLIGLDQSNRLPVLQVLPHRFLDWQIVLLTHDRVWFEMARFFLADRSDWSALELFEEIEPGGGSRPVPRPENVDAVASNLATARQFHALHQYPAAAVHARVALELTLKKLCDAKGVPVPFHIDPRKTTSEQILNAVSTWLNHPSRAVEKAAADPAIAQVKAWRSVVLNPFSHSTPVSLTSIEVINAIDEVEALHFVFRDHILRPGAAPAPAAAIPAAVAPAPPATGPAPPPV